MKYTVLPVEHGCQCCQCSVLATKNYIMPKFRPLYVYNTYFFCTYMQFKLLCTCFHIAVHSFFESNNQETCIPRNRLYMSFDESGQQSNFYCPFFSTVYGHTNRGNQLCYFHFCFTSLTGKNLLLLEQILSFKS